MRKCEICSGYRLRQLHRQSFIFSGTNQNSHYDVVSCEHCGFVYADNIPSQAEQDAYYEASGRHLHATSVPTGLTEAHRTFFDFITSTHPNLATNAAVLDIGSSMGHFLNLFKTAGFTNIQGLEPSSMASELAKKNYDIDVVPATLEDFQPGRKFDLITLCGVLEHLVSLNEIVSRISHLLSDRGVLFIAVPDASSFGEREPREPFLEFAIEHINFFTGSSLDNLLRPHGLKLVASKSQWNDFYANRYLLALYTQDTGLDDKPIYDSAGHESMTRYVGFSNSLLAAVNMKINPFADSGAPLIIWGAGSLASRLCATTKLPECNILGFVDINPQLHGQSLLGRPIHPPEWINKHRNASILITSYVYGEEILKSLTEKFQWAGQVVTI